MKKILCLLGVLLMVVGCSCNSTKAKDAVENYLNSYKELKDEVLMNISEATEKEDLNEEQKKTYQDILKRQYRDLVYTIENEAYNGNKAYVTVKITVYDLYKVQKDAAEYLANHEEEFKMNDKYDHDKYLDYRLKGMYETKNTISYTIVFNVNKTDGKWQVEQPSEEVLEKLHGVYNYEEP